MKRWHQEVTHMVRQLKIYRSFTWHPVKINELGRFRKRKPMDCGQTQCMGCHNDKYPTRLKTRREIRSDLAFREWAFYYEN